MWPKRWPRHGDRSSPGSHIQLPPYILWKQKKNRSTRQLKFRTENTLRRLTKSKLCWPFSSWQIAILLQTFITTVFEYPSCKSYSPQGCPRLTGNLRSLSCLKIFSKRVSKFTIHWLKMTDDRSNYFHSLMTGDALQTFKNIKGPTRKILG